MNEVEAVEVKWLWYPYIPFGKITVIQGDRRRTNYCGSGNRRRIDNRDAHIKIIISPLRRGENFFSVKKPFQLSCQSFRLNTSSGLCDRR
jgi:hypothetical protein